MSLSNTCTGKTSAAIPYGTPTHINTTEQSRQKSKQTASPKVLFQASKSTSPLGLKLYRKTKPCWKTPALSCNTADPLCIFYSFVFCTLHCHKWKYFPQDSLGPFPEGKPAVAVALPIYHTLSLEEYIILQQCFSTAIRLLTVCFHLPCFSHQSPQCLFYVVILLHLPHHILQGLSVFASLVQVHRACSSRSLLLWPKPTGFIVVPTCFSQSPQGLLLLQLFPLASKPTGFIQLFPLFQSPLGLFQVSPLASKPTGFTPVVPSCFKAHRVYSSCSLLLQSPQGLLVVPICFKANRIYSSCSPLLPLSTTTQLIPLVPTYFPYQCP